jgi:hypothetical protein
VSRRAEGARNELDIPSAQNLPRLYRQIPRMLEKLGRIRLLYIVLGVLLLVGLLPLTFAGFVLSGRSANELRSIEGRYQAQLVQDKARQIELYGQRYRDVVTGLARAFEIAGGIQSFDDRGYDQRLQMTLQEDPNLIALALWPVDGTLHRAFQPDVIRLDEVDARVSEVLARMNSRGVVVSRPQIIRSGQEMALTIAEPVLGGANNQDVVACRFRKFSTPCSSRLRRVNANF